MKTGLFLLLWRRKKRQITGDLGKLIHQTWVAILKNTRYCKKNNFGLDGRTYHFNVYDKTYMQMTGKTWSPQKETLNGKAVLLGTLLKKYSLKNGKKEEDNIIYLCNEMLKKFGTDSKGISLSLG